MSIAPKEKATADLDCEAGTLRLGYFVLDGAAAEVARQAYKAQYGFAFAAQGPRAFEDPKSSAVVHEAGHAVVFAHHDFDVRYAKVWQLRGVQQGHWVGEVRTIKEYIFDTGPHTSPDDDFRNACIQFAGRCAELLFDRENVRLGSSLDEVVLVQLLAQNISQKSGIDPSAIMAKITASTHDVLKRNEVVVREVATLIDRKGVAEGEELKSILAKVSP